MNSETNEWSNNKSDETIKSMLVPMQISEIGGQTHWYSVCDKISHGVGFSIVVADEGKITLSWIVCLGFTLQQRSADETKQSR